MQKLVQDEIHYRFSVSEFTEKLGLPAGLEIASVTFLAFTEDGVIDIRAETTPVLEPVL